MQEGPGTLGLLLGWGETYLALVKGSTCDTVILDSEVG